MNVWVTRQSAFSIQCGGLERLFMHFSKPTYVLEKLSEIERDIPFGYISEKEGLFNRHGWIELNKKTWVRPQSVGNWIGYDNPVSDFIWQKLCEHFKNEPFENWHLLEKSDQCNVEDFLIEFELSITLK